MAEKAGLKEERTQAEPLETLPPVHVVWAACVQSEAADRGLLSWRDRQAACSKP